MSDLKERILKIVQQPQLAGFATINKDGKPWVRYVMTVANADMVFRFATFGNARKVPQIAANPEAHLTLGITDPMKLGPYLQVQGRARFTLDRQERHGFWNPTLEPVFSQPDNPDYGIIIMEAYRIEYCIPLVLEPEVWVRDTH